MDLRHTALRLIRRFALATGGAAFVACAAFPPLIRAAEPLPFVVAADAQAARPIAVGASVPTLTLKTSDGADFDLAAALAAKPSLLIFYRGGWCPFCNTQLAELQSYQDKFLALGYQIFAVSPDAPGSMPATVEKNHLGYTLLSDVAMQASSAFGIAWRVEAASAERFAARGITLAPVPGEAGAFWLPVPAVFVVRPPGVVAHVFSDPNFRVRPPAAEIFAAAEAALK